MTSGIVPYRSNSMRLRLCIDLYGIFEIAQTGFSITAQKHITHAEVTVNPANVVQ